MEELNKHLLGFSEFHIEKKLHLSSFCDINLEEITHDQLDKLCLEVQCDIWGDTMEYIGFHQISNAIIEDSNLLKLLVDALNSLVEKNKFIIEDNNIYVVFYVCLSPQKILIDKTVFNYVATYFAEYFCKNKTQLVKEFIKRKVYCRRQSLIYDILCTNINT